MGTLMAHGWPARHASAHHGAPPPLPHRYRRSAAFLADVRLIHANCVKFNQANHNKYARLPPLAEQLVAEIEAELRKHAARLREFDTWLEQVMATDGL